MSANSINKISKLFNYNPSTDSIITLAAGCYWGVEHHYRKHFQDKLKHVVVGFANGDDIFQNQRRCCLTFSSDYTTLLPPTDKVEDIGTQYRSGIFASTEEDLKIAQASKEKWQPKWDNKISTEVELLRNYYDAEEYHQKYLIKNPEGYACPAHYVRDI
ncbi:unnamed protein product [Hanseniaspora opuntiae]